MNYRELSRKLINLGCHEIPKRSRGSHRKWTNPNTGRSSVIPDHGGSDLGTGIIRAIIKQLGIDWNNFKNMS